MTPLIISDKLSDAPDVLPILATTLHPHMDHKYTRAAERCTVAVSIPHVVVAARRYAFVAHTSHGAALSRLLNLKAAWRAGTSRNKLLKSYTAFELRVAGILRATVNPHAVAAYTRLGSVERTARKFRISVARVRQTSLGLRSLVAEQDEIWSQAVQAAKLVSQPQVPYAELRELYDGTPAFRWILDLVEPQDRDEIDYAAVLGTTSQPHLDHRALSAIEAYNLDPTTRPKFCRWAGYRYVQVCDEETTKRLARIVSQWKTGTSKESLSAQYDAFEIFAAGVEMENFSLNPYQVKKETRVSSVARVARKYCKPAATIRGLCAHRCTVSKVRKRHKTLLRTTEKLSALGPLGAGDLAKTAGITREAASICLWVRSPYQSYVPDQDASSASVDPVAVPEASFTPGPLTLVQLAVRGDPMRALRFALDVDQGPRSYTREVACRDPAVALEYGIRVDKGCMNLPCQP